MSQSHRLLGELEDTSHQLLVANRKVCVCVCAYVRACVYVCVRASVCVGGYKGIHMRVLVSEEETEVEQEWRGKCEH